MNNMKDNQTKTENVICVKTANKENKEAVKLYNQAELDNAVITEIEEIKKINIKGLEIQYLNAKNELNIVEKQLNEQIINLTNKIMQLKGAIDCLNQLKPINIKETK